MKTSALFLLLSALSASAAEAPGFRVAARRPLAVADGGHLVLAFEFTATNTAAQKLILRSIDYAVSVEGLPLFSGTAEGFVLPAGEERTVVLAGSGGEGQQILDRLAQMSRFNFRVSGTLHGVSASGAPVEQLFATANICATPSEVPQPRARAALSHSLLDY